MDATETTRRFFEFFGDRGHQPIPGGSLVPPDGGPVLFTTSGMHPLTRYLEGRPLTDADFRYLHQTHGLPPELVTELLA